MVNETMVDEPQETTDFSMCTIGPGSTDRYLLSVDSSEKVEEIRCALLGIRNPKTWIYVVKSLSEEIWSIYIADYKGGFPSDEHYHTIVDYVLEHFEHLF